VFPRYTKRGFFVKPRVTSVNHRLQMLPVADIAPSRPLSSPPLHGQSSQSPGFNLVARCNDDSRLRLYGEVDGSGFDLSLEDTLSLQRARRVEGYASGKRTE